MAHKDTPENVVYDFLKGLYSEEGLSYMKGVHSSAKELKVEDIDKMVDKLGVPIHQGTIKFMEEN
jgi:TRAP-type uncharacterized transport system substrate-binding protein